VFDAGMQRHGGDDGAQKRSSPSNMTSFRDQGSRQGGCAEIGGCGSGVACHMQGVPHSFVGSTLHPCPRWVVDSQYVARTNSPSEPGECGDRRARSAGERETVI